MSTLLKKQLTRFYPLVLSRHPTHGILRLRNKTLPLLPFRSVIRLGSSTIINDYPRVECNSVAGITNSANKKLMKECFTEAGVKTARWFRIKLEYEGIPLIIYDSNGLPNMAVGLEHLSYPIIAKSLFGSRGRGNTKIDTPEQLQQWILNKNLNEYIFEEFVKMTREYRLHISQDGCFYTCRKLIRNDAPAGTWQRHDDVCNWIVETNPSFRKPRNWNSIVEDCVKAQKSLGLDICAFDVMTQGSKGGVERENPEWIICESCSAPSFGDITGVKYIEEIPKILRRKYGAQN